MTSDYRWRYRMVVGICLLAGFLIIGQLLRIRFSPQASKFIEFGNAYERTWHTYYPPRGNIYDRYGNLLAGSQQVYEIAVMRNLVRNPETIAFALSNVMANHLGYNHPGYYNEVFTVAASQVMTKTNYVVVADYVTEGELNQLLDWSQRYETLPVNRKEENPPSLRGLVYRLRPQRIYPEKEVASTVLGFVDWSGKGIYGIEEQYNDLLAGGSQSYWVSVNPYQASDLPDISKGVDLLLTLDIELQASVEEILDQALESSGAQAGTVLVMDPKTGEILAMVTSPRLDLNHYWQYENLLDSEVPFNSAVSKQYEPGSVFKVFTMAAALDAGAVKPETTIFDSGSFEIGGIVIRNWDYSGHGEVNMTECMQYSLNVCLAQVAKKLGAEKFYRYLQAFGIGQLTGVDLSLETAGVLRLPGSRIWFESDLGTNSFGQGLSVTPVQMIRGVSAMVNGGQMSAPHLLRAMINNGTQLSPPYPVVGSPISAQTARTITEMLAISLETESSTALVPGYRVAGKTGTAEIPQFGGYTSSATNASFVGWGPVDDPKFLIYVWLEKPTTSPWGSVVAAPVFRQVFQEAVRLYNLPPDKARQKLSGQ